MTEEMKKRRDEMAWDHVKPLVSNNNARSFAAGFDASDKIWSAKFEYILELAYKANGGDYAYPVDDLLDFIFSLDGDK